MHLFPNTKIGDEYFDIFFLHDSGHRIVFLQPLQQQYEAWLKRFMNRGLSPRELEVVRLGLQGLTNSQLTRKLGISRATLKTHLNNIYKKIPEVRSEKWRLLKS